jgi:hypothetical protein
MDRRDGIENAADFSYRRENGGVWRDNQMNLQPNLDAFEVAYYQEEGADDDEYMDEETEDGTRKHITKWERDKKHVHRQHGTSLKNNVPEF